MERAIVTRDVLDIYDKYGGDFGLLDERWASEKDRGRVTLEQTMLFSEYLEMLQLIKLNTHSVQMKENALKRITELEKIVDSEVVGILRKRALEM